MITENPGSNIGMSMHLSVSQVALFCGKGAFRHPVSIHLSKKIAHLCQTDLLPVLSNPFLQFSLFSADALAGSEINRASQLYITVLSMKTLFLGLFSFAILNTKHLALPMISFTLSSTSVSHLTRKSIQSFQLK